MASEHRLERNRPKGTLGDRLNAIFSAADINLTKLIAWMSFVLSFFACFVFVRHPQPSAHPVG
jgi:hypothetical protein